MKATHENIPEKENQNKKLSNKDLFVTLTYLMRMTMYESQDNKNCSEEDFNKYLDKIEEKLKPHMDKFFGKDKTE